MSNSSSRKELDPSPYGSFFLATLPSLPKSDVLDKILAESKNLLEKRAKENEGKIKKIVNMAARQYGKLRVIGFCFLESSVCRWERELRNENNELVLICRWKTYVAIYCSNTGHRKLIASILGKFGSDADYPTLFSLRKISSGLLTAAFLDNQPLKAMWLAGTHKSVQVKPDSKVISGKDLKYALDPLGDTTYLAAAVRSSSAGVSLKGSGVWTKPYASMKDFSKGVLDALELIDANIGRTAILPVLANELHSFVGVEKAFDFEVVPIEVLYSNTDKRRAESLIELFEFELLALPQEITTPGAFHLKITANLANTNSPPVASLIITPDFSAANSTDLVFSASHQSGQFADPRLQPAISALAEVPSLFRVFYETGHTISVGHLALSKPKDRDFKNWKWINFQALRAIDVSKEKPTNNNLADIWNDKNENSLFSWFIESIGDSVQAQILGLAPLNQNGTVWVFCDDDSGEVADFVHVNFSAQNTPEICLIHVKAARTQSPKREMVAGPFEIVCGQAAKNVRYIDAENLAIRIADRVNDPKRPLWNSPNASGLMPNGNRASFEAVLRGIGANAKYSILIIQPQVTAAAYGHEKNQAGAESPYLGAIQLRSLLFATQNTARAVGAEFFVTGSN